MDCVLKLSPSILIYSPEFKIANKLPVVEWPINNESVKLDPPCLLNKFTFKVTSPEVKQPEPIENQTSEESNDKNKDIILYSIIAILLILLIVSN